jgi:hypothetical protein
MDVYDAEIGSEARQIRDGDGDRGATSAHRAGNSHEAAIASNAPDTHIPDIYVAPSQQIPRRPHQGMVASTLYS